MATANCFYPEEPAKGYHGVFISNPNVLTSNDHLDPMYGSPDLTCLLCKVYKAKDEELRTRCSTPRSTAPCRPTASRRRPAVSRPAARPPAAAGRSACTGPISLIDIGP